MNRSDKLSEVVSGAAPKAIEAVEFDAPGQPSQTNIGASGAELNTSRKHKIADHSGLHSKAGARWWHSQFNLMLAVFALLTGAAVLFVLLAPPPEVNQASVITASPTDSNPTVSAADAPWNESQQAQARTESQAILNKLLASKKSLEMKDVQRWAPERYQQALDNAALGDEFYKQQDFSKAIDSYQLAVDQMESLFTLLPAIISARLSAGEIAINEGKSALAKDLYNQVLALDASNVAATAGLDRANKLDQVLQLRAAANQEEANFRESEQLEDLLSAEQFYLQARDLDPNFKPVTEGLARVRSAIVEKRFQLAMSKAYQHLFANRYSAASRSFAEALKIKPADPNAIEASQQSLASDTRSSLSSLLASAKAYENEEEWTSAQSNYQTVLQRDPNQVGAKLGNIKTSARRQLDSQIRELLQDTLSFGRSERKQNAIQVLNDAKAISNKGPKLLQQIAQLETALQQSEASIKVAFVSDTLTEVSLQKMGSKVINLGQFSNKNLALKPGRYVAKGVRLGYQDVHTEIELHPGNAGIQSITIRCDQPIKASRSNS